MKRRQEERRGGQEALMVGIVNQYLITIHGLFGHTGGVRFIWPSKITKFFIFSDHLLTVSHAMSLVSDKVASN